MKYYHPSEVEPKWQKKWQTANLYRAVDFDKKRKKQYLLVEFPYPSGEGLHLGHAFTFSLMDVLARQKRMAGFNVLYPMGWDAFGLPTENYALKTGIHPAEVTKKNTARFREQMEKMALAYDWEREIDTSDPQYYKWTQWIFLQLFKHGLAYKAEIPVGWCPSCRIVLANEEIIDGRCERCGAEAERKKQSQWLLRITQYADRLADELDLVDYPESVKTAQRNWIGRSEGVTIKFPITNPQSQVREIEVFTTRIDTIFGVTAIVVAPEHPLAVGLLKKGR
ncbi:class I tRNA ligase family protein, partial [Patescibacteria group bacterium]|nr:class I tRNA ligase family protein [Patescibacteria group bacterium]